LFTYLKTNQLDDGGWGPYPLAPSEVFDTALALLAVARFTEDSAETAKAAAREYLLSRQNPDGSWPATTRPTGGESYAQQISTTAWATMALLSSN
jgi:squalene cyclase